MTMNLHKNNNTENEKSNWAFSIVCSYKQHRRRDYAIAVLVIFYYYFSFNCCKIFLFLAILRKKSKLNSKIERNLGERVYTPNLFWLIFALKFAICLASTYILGLLEAMNCEKFSIPRNVTCIITYLSKFFDSKIISTTFRWFDVNFLNIICSWIIEMYLAAYQLSARYLIDAGALLWWWSSI